jgi:hypothetical protein
MLFRNLSSKSDPVDGFELIEQGIEHTTDRREDFGSARLVRRLRAGGRRARKRARLAIVHGPSEDCLSLESQLALYWAVGQVIALETYC